MELQNALSTLTGRERAELAKLILQGLTPDDLEFSVHWPEMLQQREVDYRTQPVKTMESSSDGLSGSLIAHKRSSVR